MTGRDYVFRLIAATGLAMALGGAALAQETGNTVANAAVATPAPASTPAPEPVRLTLDQIDLAHHSVSGRLTTDTNPRFLALADPSAIPLLARARSGDLLDASVDAAGNPTRLVGVVRVMRPVAVWPRVLALAGVLGALLLAASLASGWRPQRFLIGVDNRYSNSQCQLALWFSAVAVAYGATVALRVVNLGGDFIGGVGLTANVAALSGFSALSFGGAKAITAGKVAAATARGLEVKTPSITPPSLVRDLVSNDHNVPDLGDFQMILISAVAAAIFLAQTFQYLGALEISPNVTLPDVDTTLLASFGIGQAAYLAKKGASNAGDG